MDRRQLRLPFRLPFRQAWRFCEKSRRCFSRYVVYVPVLSYLPHGDRQVYFHHALGDALSLLTKRPNGAGKS